MKIAEIQTDFAGEPGAWTDEWTVIYRTEHGVSLVREYIRPGTTDRTSWQDSGICIDVAHIPDVIEALQKAESLMKGSTG